MPPEEFEPAIPASERPQIKVQDRGAPRESTVDRAFSVNCALIQQLRPVIVRVHNLALIAMV
jgi:hypothetical protein